MTYNKREPDAQSTFKGNNTMIITETQIKLAAIAQGLINPVEFEEYTIEEIGSIAYSNWHSDNELASNWIKLIDAYNWLNSNPSQDWDSRLSNDKFGFFAENMNKSLSIFRKNGLIK
jgi:hypothetical protein